MVDVKKGSVSLHIRQNHEVKVATVVVSFKAKGNSEILKNMGCAANYSFDEVDSTAVLYALYLNVREKIYKNFAENSKSKVVDIDCGLNCGEFSIYAVCDASITCVRKTVTGILHGLNPLRCRSTYKSVVRSMGVTPSDDAFNAACNALEAGLKSVSVFVGGRALGSKSEDKSAAEEMLDIAVKKFEPEFCEKGAARSLKANDKMHAFSEMHFMSKKGSSAATVAAFAFLSESIPHLQVVDCKLVAHKSSETAMSKLADKKDLLKKQLEKLEKMEHPSHTLAFIAASNHLLSATELCAMADEKFNADSIATATTKMF